MPITTTKASLALAAFMVPAGAVYSGPDLVDKSFITAAHVSAMIIPRGIPECPVAEQNTLRMAYRAMSLDLPEQPEILTVHLDDKTRCTIPMSRSWLNQMPKPAR